MGLGTNHSTITTADNWLPDIWSNEIRDWRRSNLVFANLVSRWDREILNYGNTIQIPHFTKPSANTYVGGSAVTFNVATESKTAISINKIYESSYMVDDVLDLQAKADYKAAALKSAKDVITEQIDTDVAALVADASITQTLGVGTSKDAIDRSKILAAGVLLDEAKAPETDRAIVIDAYQKSKLLENDTFTLAQAIGEAGAQKAIVKGFIKELYGFTIYMTQNIYTSGGTVYNCAFQKDAFALAVQMQPRVYRDFVIDYTGEAIVVKDVYGVGVIRADHAVQLLA